MPRCPFPLLLVIGLAACSSDSATTDRVCDPGETQVCLCPNTSASSQVCDSDGQRWQPCACGATDGSGDTWSGAPDSVSSEDTSAAEDTLPDTTEPVGKPNVLLVIADDMGLDAEPCYGLAMLAPNAPNLQALCDRGVRFNNAWASATCSPTRATILTGRYSFRHGITAPIGEVEPLDAAEVTLPQRLGEVGVATANIGKWHLGGPDGIGDDAPFHFGWDHYEGIFSGAVQNYWDWTKTVKGGEEPVTEYATTVFIDDAISWVDAQTEPWLLWLAVNAPHSPFHIPPTGLHTNTTLGDPGDCPNSQRAECHRAAIEALDFELGRLLNRLEDDGRLERTWVIFIGDNGTPPQAVMPPVPAGRAKGTVYEGGVRVPMVIAGPDIVSPGRSVDHVVDVSDLFLTILELQGGTADPSVTIDSVSMRPYLVDPAAPPQRETAFTQTLNPNADSDGEGTAIRDAQYKLIRFESGGEALYDLDVDPWEANDLLVTPTLDSPAAYTKLNDALNALLLP
ncbi:MAG: arylsulfatase A-like enzyme [Myxococcota bacterium]|jgi:arylsulfatase A-like enzyme